MAVFTVAAMGHGLYVTRAVTIRTLGCTGGYHVGAVGVSRMRLEVDIVVIRISLVVTIRTAAGNTLGVTRCVTVCQVDKRAVRSSGVAVLAAAVRSMDNCLDITAVTGRRTVGSTGQH